MSMDALTATAFSALAKRDLPALHGKLVALAKLPPQKRAKDPDLANLIDSAMASLRALSAWAKDEEPRPEVEAQGQRTDSSSQPSEPVKELASKEPANDGSKAASEPIAERHLDKLVSIVAELVSDRARFTAIEEDLRSSEPKSRLGNVMSETLLHFGRHMNDLHDTVVNIRMVPISDAISNLQQEVNDLSHQHGKELLLDLEHSHTELDKALVQAIGEPIVQILRNACEHGIESKAERLALGKPLAGRISIKAKKEGNHVVITIADDGRGLNAEMIRRKAIEQGFISQDSTLSRKDLFNIIFERGFSTASLVTELSGRGVGMDLIRRRVAELQGMIEIDSEIGQGTTISIRLPRTLSTFNSLIVESQNQGFALPLSSVIESKRITPAEIQTIGDHEVISWQDRVLPLLHLHKVLGLERREQMSWYSQAPEGDSQAQIQALRIARRKDRLYVVIIGTGERRFGVVCDQLFHQQEVVIKSLGPILESVPCVAGGAVLARGDVVLVLDIPELAASFLNPPRRISA